MSAGSAVLLIAFILWERQTGHPMLDVQLFKNMRFSAASAAVTVAFFTLFGFISLMTQFFQFVRTYSPLSAGVHLLPVRRRRARGFQPARRPGQNAAANTVHLVATNAFDHGLSVGCVVAGADAVGGALLAAAFLPAQPPPQPERACARGR